MTNKTLVEFKSSQKNPEMPQVRDISPEELLEKRGQVRIIDVRRNDEFIGELGHIPGATLLVLDTLPSHIAEVPKDETVVFVCRSGGRSARATAFALDSGYQHVYNMKGGMIRWNELGFETET